MRRPCGHEHPALECPTESPSQFSGNPRRFQIDPQKPCGVVLPATIAEFWNVATRRPGGTDWRYHQVARSQQHRRMVDAAAVAGPPCGWIAAFFLFVNEDGQQFGQFAFFGSEILAFIETHAAFDFDAIFVYSGTNGGRLAPDHLLNATVHGGDRLTGGKLGPEASLLVFPVIAAMLAFHFLYRARNDAGLMPGATCTGFEKVHTRKLLDAVGGAASQKFIDSITKLGLFAGVFGNFNGSERNFAFALRNQECQHDRTNKKSLELVRGGHYGRFADFGDCESAIRIGRLHCARKQRREL